MICFRCKCEIERHHFMMRVKNANFCKACIKLVLEEYVEMIKPVKGR